MPDDLDELVRSARSLGASAPSRGVPRVPAADPGVLALTRGLPLGPGPVTVYRAWLDSYDDARRSAGVGT